MQSSMEKKRHSAIDVAPVAQVAIGSFGKLYFWNLLPVVKLTVNKFNLS